MLFLGEKRRGVQVLLMEESIGDQRQALDC